MNEIPKEVRARLKRLESSKEYSSWFWDEEQWALLLDDRETADETGYVAIVPEKYGRWCVKFVIAEEWGDDFDPRILIFEELSEAKRYVDMVIGLDSGEMPIFGDGDLRW